MCGFPLGGLPMQSWLASVSWPWIVAVALIAGLAVVGWNYLNSPNQSMAAVPASTPKPTNTPRSLSTTVASAPTATSTPSPVPTPTPLYHEIQSGETVYYVASYYGVSPEDMMEANGLDENSARRLQTGQKLLIPSIGPVGGPVPGSVYQAPQIIHEVESGETLISIADDYDTTVEAIMAANQLTSPDLIFVGHNLIVPLMPPTSTLTPTPTPTPSSTPGPPYAAPYLLSPPNSTVFRGEDAVILLSWASVGILRENQVYLVELETPARTTPITYTTHGTSWRLPSDLWPTGRRRGLSWHVIVVEQDNANQDGQAWHFTSLPSETRRFVWQ
jgi:LysM repeat protein